MMDLSIIIVNWNTKEYLIQCLDSIQEADRKDSWETIVVDNGSQDGSQDIVEKYYPWVSLIENKINYGFAKAANHVLRQIRRRYVLLLNPDTRVKQGAIEKLVSFMDRHRDAGVVGVQLLNSDGSKQNSIANFPSLATELLNKRLLRWISPKQFPGKERSYTEPVEVDSVIGACMMIRREAMDQVGYLDENYFLFLEETDWCYRMRRAGWKVFHIPDAEIYHLQGKSAERDKKRAKVEYYRSRYKYFKKHKGKTQCDILLIGLIIKLMVEFLLTGLANLLTLFTMRKWKRRCSIYSYLLWWHLKACPEGMGLMPSQEGNSQFE